MINILLESIPEDVILIYKPIVSQVEDLESGMLSVKLEEMIPVRRLYASLHILIRRKGITKNNIKLSRDAAGGRVKNQSHAASMKRGMTKVNPNMRSWFPLWRVWTHAGLRLRIKNTNKTEECVKGFHQNRLD